MNTQITLADLTLNEALMLRAFINEGRNVNGADTVERILEDNMTWNSATDLAETLGWSKAKIGGVMSQLDAKGLISDSGESARGARDTDWTATYKGVILGFPLTELSQREVENSPEFKEGSKPSEEAKDDKKQEFLFTSAEADKFIRNQPDRVHFSLRVGTILPTVNEDGSETGRGFEGLTFVSINRKQARAVVADILKNLEERGARIRITFHKSDYSVSKGHIFIG